MKGFQFIGGSTVRDDEGRDHDVFEAIERLPWVDQTCPGMPHQYAHKFKSDRIDYGVVDTVLTAQNGKTYRAYFRGYQSPNRYWEAPDGRRYWLTFNMINRCRPDSVEPLRHVAPGVKPVESWAGPPLTPNGSGLYERYKKGWLPTEEAIAAGYRPCVSCQIKVNVRRRHLPSSQNADTRTALDSGRIESKTSRRNREAEPSHDVPKARVVRRLLELRASEAPLGSTGYRGVLSQKAIAEVAEVPVQDVTDAAIAMDREKGAAEATAVE